jgi:hypothetical protein
MASQSTLSQTQLGEDVLRRKLPEDGLLLDGGITNAIGFYVSSQLSSLTR